ncbi:MULTISPECIES: FUSC family protein [unclassified Ensifer]|uniref:FUSC family protein n=1 Tax=unclassified Ensifer TaxID=2633371 RepID=UPI000812CC06|nr:MULTISPECIES: FUSC family protein [unclassified Ensifer]OCP02721.1 hypothetical protein BC362_02245 [Ensifer sp. LC14]OCP13622.1 hypothetical protein BC374_12285 [Ensifer sp. LC13]OCP14282.1 hypothetical protein BBX50_12565 [Ensifer sp. LC11]OCP28985.1 hypothetical protein BC364_10685 [Ensifer sp. LC499]
MLVKPRSSVSYVSILRDELLPYPGRLDRSLRMAFVCMLVVVTAMALEVPEAAISCYLVFFASRADAGSGIVTAAGLLVGASLGILIGILCLTVVADEPALRMALVVFFTFGGMYLTQASRAGPPIGTVAMVFAFVMTLYDIVPIPELLIRGLGWMWVVVFFPMIYLIGLNVVAGHSPARLLRSALAERLDAAACLLSKRSEATERRAAKLLAEGNGELGKYLGFSRLLALMNGRETQRMAALIAPTYELLTFALADAIGAQRQEADGSASSALLRRVAGSIRQGQPSGPALLHSAELRALGASDPVVARLVRTIVAILSGKAEPVAPPAAQARGFFLPDAFTNPAYTQFALKALLAVMITYITYTALDWFAIHTAMITCFMVALGTTGETMHKLALRIVGCLLGGAVAVGSTVWLVPHMTDIGQLALLVGAVSLVAAWISTGSERISYMGWQMALCFFLVVLHGFGPSLDLAEAKERIIGIVFGNVVVSAVFSTIWPVSIGAAVRERLSSAASTLADLLKGGREVAAPYADLVSGLAEALRQSEMLRFEPSSVRRHEIDAPTTEHIVDGLQTLAASIIMLREHDRTFGLLHGAPRPLKSAALSFENAVRQWLTKQADEMKTEGRRRNENLSAALRQSKTRIARVQRRSEYTRGFPRRIRDELTWRLELYEKIETVIRQMEREVSWGETAGVSDRHSSGAKRPARTLAARSP